MSNFNKSTLTDDATTENNIIDWEGVKIIDNEPNNESHLDEGDKNINQQLHKGNYEHVYYERHLHN